MPKKHLTELFPWLLPLRKKQRQLFFYSKLHLDKNIYTSHKNNQPFPYLLFADISPLYNKNTGFDMVYQENKVFNLKLAARELDGLLIYPGETFSFSLAIRNADKQTPYKEGLVVEHNRLTTSYGGGLCQMSNALFWAFLHSPLTIIERHGHGIKEFPEPNSDQIKGVDATIAEGWLDLKVRNDTLDIFQINLAFDATNLQVKLSMPKPPSSYYKVSNGQVSYLEQNGKIIEQVAVYRHILNMHNAMQEQKQLLYTNSCVIAYPLPENTVIQGRSLCHEG